MLLILASLLLLILVSVATQAYFSFSGVVNNLPVTSVTGGGWTQCFSNFYTGTDSLATLQSDCYGSLVMVACRVTNSDVLEVAAYTNRSIVFYDIGTGTEAYTTSNGKLIK